jgi:tRNA dimethylallyltransferase
MNYNLITILGPTAVGKTRLASLLAKHFAGEIISADSRQVYCGMDIGTGKDLDDYIVEGEAIQHHLINVINPDEEFNLFLFSKLFYQAFNEISSRKKIPFFVGGTGLYLHSVLKNYSLNKVEFDKNRIDELEKFSIEELTNHLKEINPVLHNTTDLLVNERIIRAILVAENENHLNNSDKAKINSLTIGIKLEREEIKKRITNRLKQRLQNGMIEEVKQLIENGITYERLELFGLEYKFVGRYLKGELNYNDMFQKLNSSIHGFAKRQMTWYRKMEREEIEIHWIEAQNFKAAEQIIKNKYFS